ncbi:SRPBCC family protein [Methylocapsa palsarum]|uniref:Polyketide cyclase / dehydrase and lipid transport n=1 Tax=Methylocapsa palsarum TaxID=1612308 RepID=A0A1I3ZS93_9HYPH|nr:SRPBCC family protein [Methylocapsa palsarum]SFK46982.1 Polyketide cyclase / dehydrase and lipid transport [Methylocapsa palsarum]
MRNPGLTAAFVLLLPTSVLANQVLEKVEVRTTPDKAWAAIGDFCGIKEWHPAVASCELKQDGKARERILTGVDGGMTVEREMTRSDAAHAYSYRGLESLFPVEHYVSTIRVLPMDHGRVNILWVGAFKPVGPASDAEKAISANYLAGLQELKSKLEAKQD